MKKTIAFIITIALACSLVFAVGATTAFAATAPTLEAKLSSNEAAQGGTVHVDFKVTNNDAAEIKNCVITVSCTGGAATMGGVNIASIAAGSFNGASRDITVGFNSGQTQIGLTFTLNWQDSTGTAQTAISLPATAINLKVAPLVKITGSDSIVGEKEVNAGDKVKFKFVFKNEGNVDITNAALKAPPLNGGSVIGSAFTLAPGASKTMEWSEKINKSVTVKPVLTYTASGTNASLALDSLKVTVKEVAVNSGMSLQLTSDKTVAAAGDQVTITATITNTGTDTLTDIKLLDGNGNPVITQHTSLDAGQSTTATIPETLQATANYLFSATANNSKGTQVTASSNPLTIEVGGPSPSPSASASATGVQALTIKVIADTYELEQPGNVKFQVTVQNSSSVLLSNVMVTEETLGDIGTISAMGTDTKMFNKTVTVDKSSDYIFTVTATQPDGKTITAVTKALSITVNSGSLFGGDMWSTILIIVIIAIAVVGLILFLLYRKNRSGGGYGGQPRSYAQTRKPPSYNMTKQRDVAQPKAVRKPVSPGPSSPKGTKFGDRNKF